MIYVVFLLFFFFLAPFMFSFLSRPMTTSERQHRAPFWSRL